MFKFFGLLFLSLILSIIITFINFKFGSNYISFFINQQLITSLLTIIGFNAASIVFLISQLTSIEIKQKVNFNNSKKEIFHNFIGMIILLIIEFILISSYKFNINYSDAVINSYDFIYFSIILTFFFTFLYLFFEILEGIIHISKNN